VQGTDGSFYGSTDFGGILNSGTIFRVTTGGAFETIHSFGDYLRQLQDRAGPMIVAPDGSILGASGVSIFEIVGGPPGGFLTLLTEPPSWSLRFGPLTLGADGLYSAVGNDVIKIDFATGGVGVLHAFVAGEGTDLNALIAAPDGSFYGTAHGGGAFGFGAIFR